jgi:hypothetical protein
MYALTIIPSVFGITPILIFKATLFYYLIYEAVMRMLNMNTHPASEAKIWTTNNWLLYSLRRVLVEYVLSFFFTFTQTIPVANWVINLIPIGLSYVNIFVL